MTKHEAKKITLEVWGYLRDHPKIASKCQLPKKLYRQIEPLSNDCPLCELFQETRCAGCPLEKAGERCVGRDGYLRIKSIFGRWSWEHYDKFRAQYAGRIYNIVKAWKV